MGKQPANFSKNNKSSLIITEIQIMGEGATNQNRCKKQISKTTIIFYYSDSW